MTDAPGVIRTVGGDIDAGAIGPTLLHDHIISSLVCYWEPHVAPAMAGAAVDLSTLAEVRRNPFAVRANLILNDITMAVTELRKFSDAGGYAIVEASSLGLGRDPPAIRLVSELSGVPIVLGCGYYIRSSHPPGLAERKEAALAAEIEREIREGIDGTRIRAGVIGEIGVGTYPMHPVERRVLRAAARAQVATGAGLIVHAAPGERSAFEIARVLANAGAAMDKVLVSHVEERFRSSRVLYRRLAAYGCMLGFDTFGREIFYAGRGRQHPSDAERIRMVLELLDMGIGDRIILDQDICLRHELTSYGGHGYGHVLVSVVPRLRNMGVPDDSIDRMLVGNPGRFLALPA